MKIIGSEIFILKSIFNDRPFPVKPVVVKLTSDEGIVGFGEAGISAGLGTDAVFSMTAELSRFLIGKDVFDEAPTALKKLPDMAYGHISGGGAVFSSAISALDIALWDMKGKALGLPVCSLLGGVVRDEFDCYASQLHDGWGRITNRLATPEDFAEATELVISEGYKNAKYNLTAVDENGLPIGIDVTRNPAKAEYLRSLAEERLAAIRKAGGADFGIIGESLSRMSPATAMAIDSVSHDYGMLYMEEPYFSYDPELYERASLGFKTPLAAGEKLHGMKDFLPYFSSRSLSVVQPDITMCGGLTEAKRICDLAGDLLIGAQPHLCGTPLAAAATLQLEATLGNFVLHEVLSTSFSDEMKSYCNGELQIKDGKIKLPRGNGIGVEISEKAMNEAKAKIKIN